MNPALSESNKALRKGWVKLGVNVDHIGTIRNARGGFEPDPVRAALICQKAGADSIVMHLREDRRHIQDKDLFRAKDKLSIRLNMEMSIAKEIVQIAKKLKPAEATLVPERRQERTTEGGLNLLQKPKAIRAAVDTLRSAGVRVSLFVDPDKRQIESATQLQAHAIEFHTGDYALAQTATQKKRELDRLREALAFARTTDLVINAGHGLDYDNLKPLLKFKGFNEFNIGYSIITRAQWVGLKQAVQEMRHLIKNEK